MLMSKNVNNDVSKDSPIWPGVGELALSVCQRVGNTPPIKGKNGNCPLGDR